MNAINTLQETVTNVDYSKLCLEKIIEIRRCLALEVSCVLNGDNRKLICILRSMQEGFDSKDVLEVIALELTESKNVKMYEVYNKLVALRLGIMSYIKKNK
jgi:hypothetical protein